MSLCLEIATHSSPIVFPEKRTKKPKAFSKRSEASITDDQTGNKSKREEHRIDIGGGDEKFDLLGYVVYSGKLILDNRKNVPDDNNNSTVEKDSSNDTANEQVVAAKLTSKALVWGSHVLSLDDVVSVRVELIFKLAGFKLEVVKTTSACQAKKLASTVDISTCLDGIICVGGDGIINKVLNGLLIRDLVSAAISIVKVMLLGIQDEICFGGLTATDVFAIKWIQTGLIHFGMTVSYYGFVSDGCFNVTYLGIMHSMMPEFRFLYFPKYHYEVEHLPAAKEDREGKISTDREVVDMSDLYTDVMSRSNADCIPRASSLSSIDLIMTPSRASEEPSEYVRGLDPKAKRLSFGRNNVTTEPEVIHPQLPPSTTPNRRRTRSKSRTDEGWGGLTAAHDPSRCSWGNAATNDREDISSTLSDPGPVWDAEPKWDTEANWDVENPIELPAPRNDLELGAKKEAAPRVEDEWIVTKGPFLRILVCNHACRTVQSSQVVAPRAEPDDNTMDMLLVHGSERLRLMMRFFVLQMGKHLSLPYVEYVKVKSVKIKAGKHTHNGCGIDGEFFPLNGEVMSSLLPEQCRLIGHFRGHHDV
ncbi:sphingoid long-chain bases kinase 1-like isoform X1 [Gossypium australe]|uniref:Sphingoid long-chain bases kinase 1-like isoform X1 n=1 Tax=Gossypium australe TaxID=47621 RepID=A0A5B6X5T7_9ROSI|nr:sphingoid long-chain bases kinase 1-like isoform X1 [Gossypium australe]